MRSRLKIAFMVLFLCAAAVMLSGCSSSPHFDFELTDELSGKYIDILLPIKDDDEDFTNDKTYWYKSEENLQFSAEKEIVSLEYDGFRSMLFHLDNTMIYIENNTMQVYIPTHYSGYQGYQDFCNKYKFFRIAVFDESGNVIQVSEKFPLEKAEFVIDRDRLNYSFSDNTIDPEFKVPIGETIFISAMEGMCILGLIYMLILILVMIFAKKDKSLQTAYIIIASILNIAPLIFIVLLLRMEICTHLTFYEAIKHLLSNYQLEILLVLLPLIFLTVIVTLYVKARDPEEIQTVSDTDTGGSI